MMIANADLAEFLNAAASSGCPKDQTTGFTKAGYVPLPGFLPFHAAARAADRVNGPEWLALGGKRGPGKSHAAMAQAALDEAVKYAGFRMVREKPMAEMQGIQWMLAEMYSKTEAARWLTYRTAFLQDQKEP